MKRNKKKQKANKITAEERKMEKLYYKVPYIKEFEAEILSCEQAKDGGYWAVMDRTAFYPEGGGQPADTGMLHFLDLNGTERCVHVTDTRERGEMVCHKIEEEILPGTLVHGKVDWEARFLRMQEHSGEHIISGILHHRYGFDNVGFHMGTDEVTLDVNGVISMEELWEVENEANQIAEKNIPIRCYYPDEEMLHTLDYRSKKELTGAVRIVEIPDVDLCACCGIHVERTGEIGMIKITGMIHYKGGMRISMMCGSRAREDYERRIQQMRKISVLLSAKPEELAAAVERQKEILEEKERDISSLYTKWQKMKLQTIQPAKRILVREDDLSVVQLRQYADALAKQEKGEIVLAIKKKEENVFQYVLTSQTQDMKVFGKALKEHLHGNGGGSSKMQQGIFEGNDKEIRDGFESTECKEN